MMACEIGEEVCLKNSLEVIRENIVVIPDVEGRGRLSLMLRLKTDFLVWGRRYFEVKVFANDMQNAMIIVEHLNRKTPIKRKL